MEHNRLVEHLILHSPPKPIYQIRRFEIDKIRGKYMLESISFRIRESRQLKTFWGKIVERVTFDDSTEMMIIENSRFGTYDSREPLQYKDFIAIVVSNDYSKTGLVSNDHPAVKFFIDEQRQKRERLVASAMAL